MNIIICDDLYLYRMRCTPVVLHPLLKDVYDTPLVLLTLKFHDLHSYIHLHPVYMHNPFLTVYYYFLPLMVTIRMRSDGTIRMGSDEGWGVMVYKDVE